MGKCFARDALTRSNGYRKRKIRRDATPQSSVGHRARGWLAAGIPTRWTEVCASFAHSGMKPTRYELCLSIEVTPQSGT
jgi:hypothetical protein